ncbi:hypothetical protein [Runella limosa]|uniref:hypothetical protein n=1 Tax=Runella limosa TaxID=370978 RepID=UPI00040D05EC|nr:hypothetical protein [Runella limosa]
MESTTKKISETIAVIIPLLVVCSCIRLITYYSHWNIPIFDYLTTSEIALYVIEPLFKIAGFVSGYLALVLLLIVIITLWIVFWSHKSIENDNIDEKIKEGNSFFSKLNKNKWWRNVSFLITIFVIFNSIWFEFDKMALIVFHSLIWATFFDYFAKKNSHKDKYNPVIVASTITILSFSFFIGRYDWNKTETSPNSYKIILSDTISVETNRDKIYLGKTKDFFFFYEKKSRQVSIIPSNEVKSLTMTNVQNK